MPFVSQNDALRFNKRCPSFRKTMPFLFNLSRLAAQSHPYHCH